MINKKLSELTTLTNVISGDYLYVVKNATADGFKTSKFELLRDIPTQINTSTNITSLREICLVDTTSAAVTLLIATEIKLANGAIITIKDATGNAATNNITIAPLGGGTIDGVGSYVISTNYGFVKIISTGTGVFNIIG